MKKFNDLEFEKNIPHEMRFKSYDIIKNNTLYWITQDEFDYYDLQQFADALLDTPFKYAFVILRDNSSYNLYKDIENSDELYYVDIEGNIQKNDTSRRHRVTIS